VSGFSKEQETRLLKQLGDELELWKEMRELTEKQAQSLEADDADALDGSIESRQGLIEKINGLHQETDLLMQSYNSFLKTKPGKKSAAVEEATEKLRIIITGCVELNEKNIEAAKGLAKGYTEKIGKSSETRKGLGAYAQNVPNNSELFEKKT